MPTDEPEAPGAAREPHLAAQAFRHAPFPYMRWAKAHLAVADPGLGLSGLGYLLCRLLRFSGFASAGGALLFRLCLLYSVQRLLQPLHHLGPAHIGFAHCLVQG